MNELEKMAKFNKKHNKGWGWFVHPKSSINIKTDAGNVPYNNAVFNSGMGISTGGGEAMAEEINMKEDKVIMNTNKSLTDEEIEFLNNIIEAEGLESYLAETPFEVYDEDPQFIVFNAKDEHSNLSLTDLLLTAGMYKRFHVYGGFNNVNLVKRKEIKNAYKLAKDEEKDIDLTYIVRYGDKVKDYLKNIEKVANDLINLKVTDFIFDKDSFEEYKVNIAEFYNDLVGKLHQLGYGLSSIKRDHTKEDSDMFNYTYNVSKLEESLDEKYNKEEYIFNGYKIYIPQGHDRYFIMDGKGSYGKANGFQTKENAEKFIQDELKEKGTVTSLEEDLIQSDSDEAFKKNVETELKAGKPKKQALAIAYSIKEKNRMKENLKTNKLYEGKKEMKENLDNITYGVDYRIQSLQEVMEGMVDNATPEEIDYTINMFRAIGRKLGKANFESIVALTGDIEYDPENYNFHGEEFIKKYPELKYYQVEDLEFVREEVNHTIWLYFRDEDAAFAYIDIIAGINNKVDESLKEKIKESKQSNLEQELRKAIRDYYSDFDDEEYEDLLGDYVYVEVKPEGDQIKAEVRMEIGYDAFMDLIDEKLDPIIQKYDKDAYFDMEDAGIANVFLSKKSLKEEDKDKKSITEARMKDIYTEIQEAGGKEAYILQLEDELKDLDDYRDYLDTIGREEIGRGGNFDSTTELENEIKKVESEMDEINNKLSIVRK